MTYDIYKASPLAEVSEGIATFLPEKDRHSRYDHKVQAYDMLVGNRFYNRLFWGNWPSAYRDFCRQSLNHANGGFYLDAGCGSLVFTANEYAHANHKLIVLVDRSLGMLEQGRKRIMKIRGHIPGNIVFLQGDVFDLPFRDHIFDAVASFGLLHVFDNKAEMISEMERVKHNAGKLFFSSLVGNDALSQQYLRILQQAGEVATCHTSDSLASLLAQLPCKYQLHTIGNMAYAQST